VLPPWLPFCVIYESFSWWSKLSLYQVFLRFCKVLHSPLFLIKLWCFWPSWQIYIDIFPVYIDDIYRFIDDIYRLSTIYTDLSTIFIDYRRYIPIYRHISIYIEISIYRNIEISTIYIEISINIGLSTINIRISTIYIVDISVYTGDIYRKTRYLSTRYISINIDKYRYITQFTNQGGGYTSLPPIGFFFKVDFRTTKWF